MLLLYCTMCACIPGQSTEESGTSVNVPVTFTVFDTSSVEDKVNSKLPLVLSMDLPTVSGMGSLVIPFKGWQQ